MTTDALPEEQERPRDPMIDAIPIGGYDRNIFLCPRCTRPLAVGVSRCAGCGMRLVAGTSLVKVIGFVGMGLLLGVALTVGLVGTLALLAPPTVAPTEPPVASAPSAAPGASGVPVPADPTVPRAALSALRQSALLNQRLLTDQQRLARVMRSSGAGASEIAPVLRSLAWTVGFGEGLGANIATWDAGTAFSKSLDSFYGSITRVADDGLSASIRSDSAYREAGRKMLVVLGRVTDVDKAARALATTAAIDLPPLSPR